jgi:hypothetical protein
VLEHHRESADWKEKTAQIFTSQNKGKVVPVEMHGCTSNGCVGVNKIIDKVRQSYYWLQLRGDVERFCQRWMPMPQDEGQEPDAGSDAPI